MGTAGTKISLALPTFFLLRNGYCPVFVNGDSTPASQDIDGKLYGYITSASTPWIPEDIMEQCYYGLGLEGCNVQNLGELELEGTNWTQSLPSPLDPSRYFSVYCLQWPFWATYSYADSVTWQIECPKIIAYQIDELNRFGNEVRFSQHKWDGNEDYISCPLKRDSCLYNEIDELQSCDLLQTSYLHSYTLKVWVRPKSDGTDKWRQVEACEVTDVVESEDYPESFSITIILDDASDFPYYWSRNAVLIFLGITTCLGLVFSRQYRNKKCCSCGRPLAVAPRRCFLCWLTGTPAPPPALAHMMADLRAREDPRHQERAAPTWHRGPDDAWLAEARRREKRGRAAALREAVRGRLSGQARSRARQKLQLVADRELWVLKKQAEEYLPQRKPPAEDALRKENMEPASAEKERAAPIPNRSTGLVGPRGAPPTLSKQRSQRLAMKRQRSTRQQQAPAAAAVSRTPSRRRLLGQNSDDDLELASVEDEEGSVGAGLAQVWPVEDGSLATLTTAMVTLSSDGQQSFEVAGDGTTEAALPTAESRHAKFKLSTLPLSSRLPHRSSSSTGPGATAVGLAAVRNALAKLPLSTSLNKPEKKRKKKPPKTFLVEGVHRRAGSLLGVIGVESQFRGRYIPDMSPRRPPQQQGASVMFGKKAFFSGRIDAATTARQMHQGTPLKLTTSRADGSSLALLTARTLMGKKRGIMVGKNPVINIKPREDDSSNLGRTTPMLSATVAPSG